MTDPADATNGPVSSEDVVEVVNPSGDGRCLIVCEHASHFIPPELGDLGLPSELLQSHIAWDPGALPVAKALAGNLDATLVAQRISRLVYDCNRPLNAASAIPETSEIYDVPGNRGLSDSERQERFERFYVPFREILTGCIRSKMANHPNLVVLTVHSFTPVYRGMPRDLDIGILHDTDSRLADKLLDMTESDSPFRIRRNEPYGPQDGVTFTLAEHAQPQGLLNAMFEIRNDLIADKARQRTMADWLAQPLETPHKH